MLIVGENLRGLIIQEKICDEQCFDNTCISLSLGPQVVRLVPNDNYSILDYGDDIPNECITHENVGESGLILPPRQSIIASSFENISIPMGYFGLLQTKGSLARMMVSLHFSDGQIDPGFVGKVTFEIMNASDFSIRIRKRQAVGNLYIFKTSTNEMPPYHGRYQNANGPTIFRTE